MSATVTRWTVIEMQVDAWQVDAESARVIAEWCGGWACDDLRWTERMNCYCYPDDHPKWPGAMFPSWGSGKVPGGVMLSYGVPVAQGDWIVLVRGQHVHMADDEFRARYSRA